MGRILNKSKCSNQLIHLAN